MSMTTTETSAVRADAKARRAELLAVKALLLPDSDDPVVMSELTSIMSALDACERALS
jgi:hypothetical protein